MSLPDITEQRTPLCRVTAGEQLDAAWHWLCDARKDAPANADIWHLRYHWRTTRDTLLSQLLNGEYRLQPMLLTKKRPYQDRQVMWGAQDALVLKWTSLLITPHLDLHPRCEHVKGHGGGPQSVQRMAQAIKTHGYAWVCRTDVKGYYQHIRKDRLMAQVRQQIPDPVLQALIHQYVQYTVEDGGEFYTPASGIARGCALSPLMGALHLYAMDAWFANEMNKKKGIYYARYMDDIVILAHTRWQLRKQVRALNGFFNEAGFSQHPDKTFIGRTERGYDWMGAQMSDAGVEGIAHRARVNHLERLRRLYERVRRWPAARRRARMSQYRTRWKIWAVAVSGAGALLLPQITMANIGTAADLDAGVRKCIANGSWSTQGSDFTGTCSIPLGASPFAPLTMGNAHRAGRISSSQGVGALLLLGKKPVGINNFTLQLKEPLTISPIDHALSTNVTWSSGATFRTGVNTPATSGGTTCYYINGGYLPPGPQDVNLTGDLGTSGIYPCTVNSVSAVLNWTTSIPIGTTIKYPSIILSFDGTNATGYGQLFVGVGGSGGVDPTPPTPPVAGTPPNCTAWAGTVGTGTVSLGTATPTKSTNVKLGTTTPQATTIGMSCTSGANGSVAAKPQLSVLSIVTPPSTDGYTLVKSGDWLGLRLKLPPSAQGSDTVASGQTLGQYVKWNGTSATPIWNWSLAANSTANSNVPVNTITLTPEIWQIAARNTTDGTRSYQVQYSVVMP